MYLKSNVSKTRDRFIGIFKHGEESSKYEAQRSIFDEIRGVWIADETLSRMFGISCQSNQKSSKSMLSKPRY